MFESYFGKDDELLKSILKEMQNKKKSMASFQKYFFENRNKKDQLMNNIDTLKNLDDQYNKSYKNIYN